MDQSQAQRQGIQKSRRNPQIINCNKYSQRQITHYIHQKAQERVTSLGHLQRIKGAARDKPILTLTHPRLRTKPRTLPIK
jgi:hypothetical protein